MVENLRGQQGSLTIRVFIYIVTLANTSLLPDRSLSQACLPPLFGRERAHPLGLPLAAVLYLEVGFGAPTLHLSDQETISLIFFQTTLDGTLVSLDVAFPHEDQGRLSAQGLRPAPD